MAQFDDNLAEMQKKLAAMTEVLNAHPNILAEVRKAHAAQPDPEVAESAAQDEARANALARVAEQAVNRILPKDPA